MHLRACKSFAVQGIAVRKDVHGSEHALRHRVRRPAQVWECLFRVTVVDV